MYEEGDPREAKLPKWAQNELSGLRRKVLDAERVSKILMGEWQRSRLKVRGYDLATLEGFYLDDSMGVEWELPGGTVNVTLQSKPRGVVYEAGLYIHVTDGGRLGIAPAASNAIILQVGG